MYFHAVGSRRWGASIVVGGMLLTTACTKRHHTTDDTLPPALATTTTTTSTIDVAKVPAVIDVPYVQAVMDSLDQVLGDAIRIFAQKKAITPEFTQLLTAVYGPQQFDREQRAYTEDVNHQPFPIKQEPQPPTTKVIRIIDSSPSCVVLEATRDYAPIFIHPEPGRDTQAVVELHPKRQDRDPSAKNPTAWEIAGEGFIGGSRVPDDPCP